MLAPATLSPIGNYCGRFGPGWWDEPFGVWSNLAFLIGAALALRAWRRHPARDLPTLALIGSGGAIGVGSFVFHAHPTPRTLPIDLIPIQIFALAYVAYAARRFLRAGPAVTAGAALGVAVAVEGWRRLIGRGVLGGAASHAPWLVAIALAGAWLRRRGRDPRARAIGRRLLAASATYTFALGVRALDLPLCDAFPCGLHGLWHLAQGTTVGLLLRAAVDAQGGGEAPPASR